jgi:hypothetical protein
MFHICGVSKTFGEWYQKTNKTEDTNKLTLLAFKIIAIAVRRQSNNVWQLFCDRFLKRSLLTVSRSFMNVANRVLWRMAIILNASKVNLFVSSVLFVFWYHSPNVLDTLHICNISWLRVKAPPGTPHSHISSLTSSGQRNCALWAPQTQKSVTLRPQPGG